MDKIVSLKYMITTEFIRWLAHRLPKRLQYFVAIDVMAYATCGKYHDTNVADLTAMEAIRRFEKDHGIE